MWCGLGTQGCRRGQVRTGITHCCNSVGFLAGLGWESGTCAGKNVACVLRRLRVLGGLGTLHMTVKHFKHMLGCRFERHVLKCQAAPQGAPSGAAAPQAKGRGCCKRPALIERMRRFGLARQTWNGAAQCSSYLLSLLLVCAIAPTVALVVAGHGSQLLVSQSGGALLAGFVATKVDAGRWSAKAAPAPDLLVAAAMPGVTKAPCSCKSWWRRKCLQALKAHGKVDS